MNDKVIKVKNNQNIKMDFINSIEWGKSICSGNYKRMGCKNSGRQLRETLIRLQLIDNFLLISKVQQFSIKYAPS